MNIVLKKPITQLSIWTKLWIMLKSTSYKDIYKNFKSYMIYWWFSEFQILSMVRTLLKIHLTISLLNPYSMLYHGLYVTYDNYRLQNQLEVLKDRCYLAKEMKKAINSTSFKREYLLKKGILLDNEFKVYIFQDDERTHT